VAVDSGAVATVDLGTPATGDNCSIASVTNNAPATFPVGTTIVTWTVTDGSGNSATVNQVVIVTVKPNQLPFVTITSPAHDTTYPTGSVVNIQAQATDADGSIAKVEFFYNGIKLGEDTTAPYDYSTGTGVEAGVYHVIAKATDNKGAVSASDTVTITISGCTAAGYIVGEGYLNIPGAAVYNLTGNAKYPDHPDIVAQLNGFEYTNVAETYGARIRGYICAPESGYYTFYISSDDQSELWLSTDSTVANKRKIAFLNSWVSFRDYQAYFTQKSVQIFLVKGAKYYIEALHKESTGSDHLSVAWVLPNGTMEAPVAGNRLAPYETTPVSGSRIVGNDFKAAMREAELVTDVNGLVVKASPNPSTGFFTLMTRSSSIETLSITLTDVLGRVVERRMQVPANGTLQIGSKLLPGVYFVEVAQGAQKEKVRLVKQ
jgi:hypothetical protein